MQIAIDLPSDFVAFRGASLVQKEIRVSYALWLYQQTRVTLSKAAQLAGLDIYDVYECLQSQPGPNHGHQPRRTCPRNSRAERLMILVADASALTTY